jgi:hypothetical protein
MKGLDDVCNVVQIDSYSYPLVEVLPHYPHTLFWPVDPTNLDTNIFLNIILYFLRLLSFQSEHMNLFLEFRL